MQEEISGLAEENIEHKVRTRFATRRTVLHVVLFLSLLGAGFSWILASPIGGSPDDDFHMGSIWCPRPASQSCETRMADGYEEILVPEPVALATDCHVAKTEQSAACPVSLSNDRTAYSDRFDRGNYPTGYYRFHHLLIRHSVADSIILMRTVNFLISVILLGAVGSLLRPSQRQVYILAMLTTWMPMGMYFITSMNPSSWAITGVFTYATAMYGSMTAKKIFNRRALLFIAYAGALLSFVSRGDSAFYIFVATAALAWAIKFKRDDYLLWINAAVLAVIGVYMMMGSGQASIVANTTTDTGNPFVTALRTFYDLPRYYAGFLGYGLGPGWFDIPLDTTVTLLALFLTGSMIFLGASEGNWRKWMSVLMVAGAMSGIPVLIVTIGSYPRLGPYQPRYMLPLLAVFMFFLWADRMGRAILSTGQKIIMFVALFVVYGATLHTVMWRYVSGIVGVHPVDLDADVQWWWSVPISPMSTWAIGTGSFLVFLLCIAFLWRKKPVALSSRETAVDLGAVSAK